MPVRKVGESHKRLAELMAAASPECPPVWVGAEEPLFMLYTSGAPPPPTHTHTHTHTLTHTHYTPTALARRTATRREGRVRRGRHERAGAVRSRDPADARSRAARARDSRAGLEIGRVMAWGGGAGSTLSCARRWSLTQRRDGWGGRWGRVVGEAQGVGHPDSGRAGLRQAAKGGTEWRGRVNGEAQGGVACCIACRVPYP